MNGYVLRYIGQSELQEQKSTASLMLDVYPDNVWQTHLNIAKGR